MMRIAYLLWGLGYTGGNQVLYRFMDELADRGHEVYAITPEQVLRWKPGLSYEVNRRIERGTYGEWIKAVAKTLLRRFPQSKQALLRLLGRSEFDRIRKLVARWVPAEVTVATYCMTAFVAYAFGEDSVPVYHMQHYEELFFREKESRLLARLTYFLPLELIANSRWLQREVERRFLRRPWLLNPGVDTAVFWPRCDPDMKYAKIPRLRIVSYADDRPFKGWNESCRAMELVFRKLGEKHVEWIVFGGGRAATSLPVCRVGKVFGKQLAELYSGAHIVFMPSWYESFPLPPIEAMACGTAVVTTRYGTEDYAEHMGNAWVVEPGRPDLLAEAIVELGCDRELMLRLAKRGIETAQRFTWRAAVERLEDILNQAKMLHETRRQRFADIEKLINGQLESLIAPYR